jgi:hypothetical protein
MLVSYEVLQGFVADDPDEIYDADECVEVPAGVRESCNGAH